MLNLEEKITFFIIPDFVSSSRNEKKEKLFVMFTNGQFTW